MIPMSDRRCVTATGTVDPPSPTVLHTVEMIGGEIRVFEQAGDEVRWSAADGQAVTLHQRQHFSRIPDIGHVDRLTVQQRHQQGADHADEMPDRRGGEHLAGVGRVLPHQLMDFVHQAVMAVDDALGRAGGAGGVGDQRGPGRVGRQHTGHRFVGEQLVEVASPTDHADDRHLCATRRVRRPSARTARR